MPIKAILILIIFGIIGTAELACVTNEQTFEYDPNLYPNITTALFIGGEPCFVGHMCTWLFRFIPASALNSSVDLAISVNFNPPLFFFLSTNQYSMKGNDYLAIEIPPPKEDKIGNYTLDLVVTAKNLTFRGCNDFEIRRVPTYNITKYTPTDNSTVLNSWDLLRKAVSNINFPTDFPTMCDQPFSFETLNDFSRYDPIKAFITSTQLNVTTVDCVHRIAARYYSAVMNGDLKLQGLGNQQELFWTDGMQLYQRFYNNSFDFIPFIDEWIPHTFENYAQGGINDNGYSLYLMTRYVDALINRMARSGEIDNRLPRAINLYMTTMLRFIVNTAYASGYTNGFMEGGYAMRTLATWGMLTNDDRVPYVLKTFADVAKTWITSDYQVNSSMNGPTIYISPEPSNALAMGFAAYWRYNGDQQNYDLAVNLLNASVVLGPGYLFSGKHILYFINRNFDTIKWLLDPSVALVESKIPFVFPDLVQPTNNTVVLPNQTIVITDSTTIVGDLQLSNTSTVSLTYGEVLNVTGCATLSGTLVIKIEDGQVILNDTVLLAYACRDGQFDELVIEGDVDPCKEYQLSYTPTTMSIIVAKENLCVIVPTGSTSDRLPDWAIAVIVIGGCLVLVAIFIIVSIAVPSIRMRVFPFAKTGQRN